MAEGNRNQLIGLVVQIMEEEENEFEDVMMALARVAAAEIMEDEEGPGMDELAGPAWAPVTVELSRVIREHLDATGRRRRERTPFVDIMLMVVWLLAAPDSFRSVALRFGETPGTLHYFYRYIIEALRDLSPRYIRWPLVKKGKLSNRLGKMQQVSLE
ncbi:hypothetical protein KUF71_001067 [Frankliniella fusca]|uniref:Transposase Helix-turn-helix domain-containing protein n=1 Tax=Frankliniella fusca TaxID=407009 RepID=A0AAE1HCU6_9NEOP|nr:hypothetical protein KUF71_001067 [Frankliniella fusca]